MSLTKKQRIFFIADSTSEGQTYGKEGISTEIKCIIIMWYAVKNDFESAVLLCTKLPTMCMFSRHRHLASSAKIKCEAAIFVEMEMYKQ